MTLLGKVVVAGLLVLTPGLAAAGDKDHHHAAGADMTMHHMHVMINHAVEMAAEGSNLVMLGEMGMAKGVDELSIRHGRTMLDEAEKIAKEVLGGEAMKKLHAEGHGTEASKEMAYTHQLGEAALVYISLLKRMAPTPADPHHH